MSRVVADSIMEVWTNGTQHASGRWRPSPAGRAGVPGQDEPCRTNPIRSAISASFPRGYSHSPRQDRPASPEQSEEQPEIKAVLQSTTIHNGDDLRRFLQRGRVTGLCSDTPGLSRGTLRTGLMEANPRSHLSSAWVIDEMSEPPSADRVRLILLGSAACHVLVIVLVILLFLKAS
jgi:hypothetical protein